MSKFNFNFSFQGFTTLLTTAVLLGTLGGIYRHNQLQAKKAEFNKSSVHSVEYETKFFVNRTASVTTIQDVEGIDTDAWDKTKGNKHDNLRFAKYPSDMNIEDIIKKEQILNPKNNIVYQSKDGIDYYYLENELIKKIDQSTGKEIKVK